jgi:lipoyl(octanoyl) transferase
VTDAPTPDQPRIVDLGRRPYGPVREEMLATLDQVRRNESGGVVFLVEHDPVYTAGRATPPDQLRDDIVEIERGGQITYHGPGQLVVYPVVRLPKKDVRAWLRAIEAFGVAVCAEFGVHGVPSVDGTGVFVGDPDDGARKIASIGVAIRHWINMHGISLNIDMDLSAFHSIRPCGLDPNVMTDLRRETGRPVSLDEARVAAAACLPTLLGSGYSSGE